MKRIIVLVSLMFFAFTFAQGQMRKIQDVVYLKDGGVMKGVILEQTPGKTLKIKMGDGSVFVYNMDEVSKITKEENPYFSPYPAGYREKNPALAWVASFFIPGLGQMVVNQQYWKGAGMLVGFGAASIVTSVGLYQLYLYDNNENTISQGTADGMAICGILVSAGIWIWSMLDAPLQARKINKKNLLTWELGESSLELRPDFVLHNIQVNNHNTVQPTVGMKLSLEF